MSAGRPPSASDWARDRAEHLRTEAELTLRDIVILGGLIAGSLQFGDEEMPELEAVSS